MQVLTITIIITTICYPNFDLINTVTFPRISFGILSLGEWSKHLISMARPLLEAFDLLRVDLSLVVKSKWAEEALAQSAQDSPSSTMSRFSCHGWIHKIFSKLDTNIARDVNPVQCLDCQIAVIVMIWGSQLSKILIFSQELLVSGMVRSWLLITLGSPFYGILFVLGLCPSCVRVSDNGSCGDVTDS